jgi:Cu(I)/Ag(I) efflux system membrane fusion protein
MRPPPSWIPILSGLFFGALTIVLIPDSVLFTDAGHENHTGHVAAATGERWACPMMDFIGDKPGDCPVCGMKMTKVVAGELTREQTRRLGLETSVLKAGPAIVTIRAQGTAEYDHRFTTVVIPRVAGRIVKRFETTFDHQTSIQQGAPIIELYSEAVIAAQAELQAALKLNDSTLVAALRARFERWQLHDLAQAVVDGAPVRETIVITAPFSGQILQDNVTALNETLAVGREIMPDTALLRLVDHDKLTLVVQVPETRSHWIVAGQTVFIESDAFGPLPQIKAVVARVAPEINPALRAREVRIHLTGARDVLSPGSLVGARLQVALAPDLKPADPQNPATWGQFVLVPKTAVLSTGIRHVAWKIASRDSSGRARFELAPLALGPRLEDENGNDLYVVRAGLSTGDEVATQGAFLIDSQAQLAGTPSLLFPQGATAPAPSHNH